MGVSGARVGVAAFPGQGRGKTPLLARAHRSLGIRARLYIVRLHISNLP